MNLGIGLGVTNYLRVPTVPLDPDAAIAALFESGEEGAWYDPSDLTTLYQDAAGTTPVTGTGQPVGLMLDKSKGLTLGSELVTNGTFDTDSNWDKGSHWTISGGVASSVNGSLRNLSQVCLTVGKTYKVSWDQTTSSGNIVVFVGLGTQTPAITGTGTKTAICKATTNTTLYFQAQNGFTGTIDNVTVKELPGNHATQSTSTARPTLQLSGSSYYLDFDGVDDWMTTSQTVTPVDASILAAAVDITTATTSNGTFASVSNVGASEHYYYGTSGPWLNTFSTSRFNMGAAYIADTHVVTISNSSGNLILRQNGSQTASQVATLTTSESDIALGTTKSPRSNYWNGRLYGVVIRVASTTTEEITTVETYLATKSGVTLP